MSTFPQPWKNAVEKAAFPPDLSTFPQGKPQCYVNLSTDRDAHFFAFQRASPSLALVTTQPPRAIRAITFGRTMS